MIRLPYQAGVYMEANELVENMVIWFGSVVSKSVFEDYLNTYIEMSKPDYWPLFLYKTIFSSTRSEEFMKAMRRHRVLVSS